METTLYIDTSSNKEVCVAVEHQGKRSELRRVTDARKAQAVLPLIDKLLTQQTLSFDDLRAVEVMTGPGSFTGLRVGISIANTLGSVLRIPVNGKAVGELVEAVYE